MISSEEELNFDEAQITEEAKYWNESGGNSQETETSTRKDIHEIPGILDLEKGKGTRWEQLRDKGV